jgi:hypothetical protein
MLEKLKEVLEYVDYARSEVYSGREELPDYRANESSRNYLSNAESYIQDVEDMLLEIVSEMNTELDVENDHPVGYFADDKKN